MEEFSNQPKGNRHQARHADLPLMGVGVEAIIAHGYLEADKPNPGDTRAGIAVIKIAFDVLLNDTGSDLAQAERKDIINYRYKLTDKQ